MNPDTPPTMAALCQEALDVQNASNLLGVSKGLACAIQHLDERLRLDGQYTGPKSVRIHPVTVLWVSKIADMTYFCTGAVMSLNDAYDWCKEQATTAHLELPKEERT